MLSNSVAHSAAVLVGGAAIGAALALTLRPYYSSTARALEQRARQAEERSRAAAAIDEARALAAQGEASAKEKREESVATVLEQIRAEWALVPKNASGRMDREIFVEHLLELHHEELMGAGTKQVYRQFLDRCFDAGVGLMLAPGKEEKADVGRHCFSYSLLLANEFYFKAAAAAEGASCPCATPVADQLALVAKPCAS